MGRLPLCACGFMPIKIKTTQSAANIGLTVIKGIGRWAQILVKAAEDSRTPRPRGPSSARKNAPASWSAAVLCRFLVGVAFPPICMMFAGCARFHARPLSASANADALESRSLTNAEVKAILEKNLRRDFENWPAVEWDFEMLTLAAFYYHPSLEVARAQWAVAQGGEKTAGQRPNPTLTVTPTYNFTTFVPSPWDPVGFIDIPIETAGKRKYRRAQAANLSQAARLNIAVTAWQVRSAVRSSLLDFAAAGRREAALEKQVLVQQEILQRQQQQAELGAIAP